MAGRRLDVSRLISHRFPVDAAEQAYAALTGAAPGLGILLEYDVSTPSAPPSAPAAPRGFVSGRLGVALVGPGAFAKNVLLPAIRAVPGVELRAAVAATGLSAQNMVQRAGFATASTDLDEMLADPSVDVLFISTRHHLHASQVIAGLRAGKHVFVEKPLCLTEEELDRIAAEYTAVGGGAGGGPLLMVGFNRRFAPLIEALTPLFTPRRRGLHIHYRVNAGQVPPTHWVHDPAVGGGRILGEGCHFVVTIAAIAGAPPMRVSAAASGSDNCSALLTLADGSEATFQYVSGGHPDLPKEYIEVLGEGMAAQVDDFRTLRTWTTKGERVTRLPAQDKGHRAEVAAFLEAVRRGGPAPIPAAALYATTRATIRLVESAATGMPLEVGIIPGREDHA
jgi:predicted dehydrogenase